MDYQRSQFVGVLLLMLVRSEPTHGSNILFGCPGAMSSHMLSNVGIAKTLAARGHDVWMVMDEGSYSLHYRHLVVPPNIQFVPFFSAQAHFNASNVCRYIAKSLGNAALERRLAAQEREAEEHFGVKAADIFHAASAPCDDMLGDADFLQRLKAMNFDMILGDFVNMYQVFLSQVLQVPYIHIGLTSSAPSQHDRFAYTPSNPAYVPERMSFLTDTMTFRERCKNTLLYWLTGYLYYKYMFGPMDEVLRKHNIRPDANFGQLLSEAEMWIFSSDFGVDFPRPLSPQVKFVGGFLTGPGEPLDEEWQSFVDSADEHGVVLVAMGTLISDELTEEQTENIAASLALLPQKVAWGYGGKLPKALGNNTKVVKWIPQNDLLAHPKTRAFISHGGLNSIHQCVYHAVPIVGIPVFGDQKDNLVRARAKGMAVYLDVLRMTERSVYDATMEVIYNQTYKATAERLSAIARDRIMPMSPLEEVVYWVEYAIKYGTRHLKPRAMQLSLVQYYLLDVIIVSVLTVTATMWCVAQMLKVLSRVILSCFKSISG